jgi:hypothetical protein
VVRFAERIIVRPPFGQSVLAIARVTGDGPAAAAAERG